MHILLWLTIVFILAVVVIIIVAMRNFPELRHKVTTRTNGHVHRWKNIAAHWLLDVDYLPPQTTSTVAGGGKSLSEVHEETENKTFVVDYDNDDEDSCDDVDADTAVVPPAPPHETSRDGGGIVAGNETCAATEYEKERCQDKDTRLMVSSCASAVIIRRHHTLCVVDGMEVCEGDVFETGKDGHALLSCQCDGTRIVVGSSSSAEVFKFNHCGCGVLYYNPLQQETVDASNIPSAQLQLRVILGRVIVVAGNDDDNDKDEDDDDDNNNDNHNDDHNNENADYVHDKKDDEEFLDGFGNDNYDSDDAAPLMIVDESSTTISKLQEYSDDDDFERTNIKENGDDDDKEYDNNGEENEVLVNSASISSSSSSPPQPPPQKQQPRPLPSYASVYSSLGSVNLASGAMVGVFIDSIGTRHDYILLDDGGGRDDDNNIHHTTAFSPRDQVLLLQAYDGYNAAVLGYSVTAEVTKMRPREANAMFIHEMTVLFGFNGKGEK